MAHSNCNQSFNASKSYKVNVISAMARLNRGFSQNLSQFSDSLYFQDPNIIMELQPQKLYKCYKCFGLAQPHPSCPECSNTQFITQNHPSLLCKKLPQLMKKVDQLNITQSPPGKQNILKIDSNYHQTIKQESSCHEDAIIQCSVCHQQCEGAYQECQTCNYFVCKKCSSVKKNSHHHILTLVDLYSKTPLNLRKISEQVSDLQASVYQQGQFNQKSDEQSKNINKNIQKYSDYGSQQSCFKQLDAVLPMDLRQSLTLQENYDIRSSDVLLTGIYTSRNPVIVHFDSQKKADPQIHIQKKQEQNRIHIVDMAQIILQSQAAQEAFKKQRSVQPQQQKIYLFEGYQCDMCEASPIKNKRYHCKQCQDFDICQKCHQQRRNQHQHVDYEQIDGLALLAKQQEALLNIKKHSILNVSKRLNFTTRI